MRGGHRDKGRGHSGEGYRGNGAATGATGRSQGQGAWPQGLRTATGVKVGHRGKGRPQGQGAITGARGDHRGTGWSQGQRGAHKSSGAARTQPDNLGQVAGPLDRTTTAWKCHKKGHEATSVSRKSVGRH